ncbi:beta-lactamase family protein [Verrucomicrobiaceae bacterium N1E253]|uniref:Beta-lactamase family protein n=1 Tax=Oceaniferula marina TaxID=2748318 RepID=A0A851GNA7_9BACT|nr:serine hydrolase [Oceaniferula marina]NWK57321.1 beta-lactamase family protein [Oceaniferula marina]
MWTKEGLKERFERNFRERGELGASVSVWQKGQELVSMADGWCERQQERPWTKETLVPFYSMTKGLASATMLMLMDELGVEPEDEVGSIWPEFPVPQGTIAQMMSHQLGVAALDVVAEVWDHEAVIASIEKQTPNWSLEEGGHGYHPRTFGFLLEEMVRRMSGCSLGEVWRTEIADPLGLDAWIGLPLSEFGRVAVLYPGKMDKGDLESGFYRELHRKQSLVSRSFFSPRGLNSVREMNEMRARQAALPAMGGIGTAAAVAQFYQAACGAISFFSPQVLGWIRGMQACGFDRILQTRTAFSCGFQMDPMNEEGSKERMHYGRSPQGFGHPGAGGSHAYADPESGLSFAYVMNQMELSPLPGPKSLDMVAYLCGDESI